MSPVSPPAHESTAGLRSLRCTDWLRTRSHGRVAVTWGWGRCLPSSERLTLRRVDVTPGDARLNYQGTIILRSLTDPGTLRSDQLLAIGVPEGTEDGAAAILTDRRWALRPGDLVGIDLAGVSVGEGYYVPQEAILVTGPQAGRIFLIGDDSITHAVDVALGPVVGGLQRIESPGLDGAPPLARVVTRGASSLNDGERVSVVGGSR